ncbi:FCD domain-containing protein [Microbacterium betulae]|uniref:FCD domain-containing protein n=1 Tax=Microbacterium betulae TaxID=2981139 RepID=A0AA97FL25_9MICO|nr:FCD domain-containing protein [Microbacterium sp. AB]WOF24260.1 FCD domain-containing protein [Microbacterium sp. AB]
MADEQRAWEIVLSHLERALVDGELSPGDRLPGERALAGELGVGRSSVREAIRVLEVLGLVRTATGSGPSSGAIIIALPGGGMSALMRLQLAATGFPVGDVVDTRLVLETHVAEDLAASAPDLAGPSALLDAMDDPALAEAGFLALDQRFHLALAEASGNQVITATMAGLRSAIEAYATAGALSVDDWETTCTRLRREHRGILAAISAGDPDAAADAVRAHITGYYDQITIGKDQHGHATAAEAR